MIPIRDTIQSRHYPVVTFSLIGINVLVFFIQMSEGHLMQQFIYTYGLVPARYTVPEIAVHFTMTQQWMALVSFMFLHGGFWHLLGNMWMLYIFGDNVEDSLGSFYFVVFYIACGLFSGLAHTMLNLTSTTPVIGASGAIAGVMGAYFILYPNARILTLVPILFIPLFFEIPAFFFLGLWFTLQVLSAAGSSGTAVSGIAWWAHIGGFVFGILSLKFFQSFAVVRAESTERRVGVRRKKSEHLQVIRPSAFSDSPALTGTIRITPYEAAAGTVKTVNIPWGFQKRLYRISIPAGIGDGSVLRLKGMGRKTPEGAPGDFYLTVRIDQPR
ncbi:MAG: rhomboid family intramembrane serine protease [Thermodesulfobacteriota bacterium]